MGLSIKHINSKFKKKNNPKVGLIALSTDQTIEGDFYTICKNLPLDIFVNRIHNQNPLTKENLLKMQDDLELVTSKILPDERINTIAYGCTSGTIAIGEDKVKEKILLAKQDCYVTTPVTSAIKAFKQMNVRKIALFTPYPDAVNKTILDYFTQKDIETIHKIYHLVKEKGFTLAGAKEHMKRNKTIISKTDEIELKLNNIKSTLAQLIK